MKKKEVARLLCSCFFGLALTAVKAQDTLAYWSLNETSGSTVKETVSNTDYTIHTQWPVVERMAGVKGNALRSDGYTTWIDGSNTTPYPRDSFSVSAWLALETYPLSTAAIWSYHDAALNRGAFVAIDKFGRVVVNFTVNSQPISFTSANRIEHYKWNLITVNVDAVNVTCAAYVNGTQFISQSFTPGSLTWSNAKVFLGRGAAEEKQGIFPLNFLNGIYDDIIVRKTKRTAAQMAQDLQQLNPASAPDMKTPASRFANDFHRPKYHPIPQSSWGNESHGLIYYNGVYHLFYQKNGNAPMLYQQNWGHLTSTDLLKWQEQQPALFPQPGWESVGTWSGHLVLNDNGVPTIFYTGVDGVKAGIGSAQSTGDLLNWERHPSNPLIPAAPLAFPNKDFRDPYVFKEGASWYMIVGSGLQSPETGTVFLYKSADLVSWQLVRPLFTDQSFLNDPGPFWEMPVFWKFGAKYMLLVNKVPVPGTPARAFYWTGDFVNDSFVVTNPRAKNLEVINSLLSPSVAYDAQNRVVAIGIIPDLVSASEHYKKGWAHTFSLPRVWQMVNDTLYQSPHPVLEQSRGTATTQPSITIQPSGSNYLTARGWQMEIKATIQPGTATQAGFTLLKNDANTEFTKIYYDYSLQKIVVDRSLASLNPFTPRDIQSEVFPLPAGQAIDWHIFLDGSVIEVFINNKWAFATRAFPVSNTSNAIDLFATGGTATASSVQIWKREGIVTGLFNIPAPNYEEVKAFPVPAKDHCYIQLPAGETGVLDVRIFDAAGKLVEAWKQRITAATLRVEWNLKGRSSKRVSDGSYYCTLNFNNKKFYYAKLLVKG